MMGIQAAPERLFYDFCLEEKTPADHLLRRIDQYLDLSDLRARLRPFYSRIGRPSVDPDADRGLLLRDPLRAAALRRG